MKRFVRIVVPLAVLALGGCKPPAEEATQEKKEAHAEHERTVKLGAEVVKAARIRAQVLPKERPASDLLAYGEIAADPDRVARITSPVAGRLESVSFREGEIVEKGKVLAVVRVPELGRIRGAQAQAATKARAARSNAKRLEALVRDRLAAEQALVDAKAEAEALEAEAASLGQQLQAVGQGAEKAPYDLSLRAPLAGAVVHRAAIVGGPVSAQEALGTIADLSEAWFTARVPEHKLPLVTTGAEVSVELAALPGKPLAGTVEAIAPEIDGKSRTAQVRVRLKGLGSGVRIGLFGLAHIRIASPDAPASPLVPRGALVDIEGRTGVFVERAEGEYHFEVLVLGSPHGGSSPVLVGLAPDSKVVVDGAYSLKGALLRSTLAEDEH